MTCHTCYITVQNVLILSTTPENECDSLNITLVAQVHNISFLISIYTICTCLKKEKWSTTIRNTSNHSYTHVNNNSGAT